MLFYLEELKQTKLKLEIIMQTKPLNKKQIKKLIKSDEVIQRDKCIMMIGFNTGLRVSELLSLKISDVAMVKYDYDADQFIVTIHDSITVDAANVKNNQTRTIVLPKIAKRFFKKYITNMLKQGLSIDNPLINSQFKAGTVALSRMHVNRILKKAIGLVLGIFHNISSHSMRKSFACSIYLDNNNSLMVTQHMLGHCSARTTEIYLRDVVAMSGVINKIM